MYFKKFANKVKGSVLQKQIVEQSSAFNIPLYLTEEGKVFIGNIETEFKTLDEARLYLRQQNKLQYIEQEVSKNIYEEVLENKIASIIKEEHNIKVTDNILEHYIELASSKVFTIDPTVQSIRRLNKHDAIFENKIDYVLADGSKVVIDKGTQEYLNNILKDQKEVLDYMRESKENFLHVVDLLTEE
jgi:hypothetical protein